MSNQVESVPAAPEITTKAVAIVVQGDFMLFNNQPSLPSGVVLAQRVNASNEVTSYTAKLQKRSDSAKELGLTANKANADKIDAHRKQLSDAIMFAAQADMSRDIASGKFTGHSYSVSKAKSGRMFKRLTIATHVQNTLSDEVLAAAWAKLTPEQRLVIEAKARDAKAALVPAIDGTPNTPLPVPAAPAPDAAAPAPAATAAPSNNGAKPAAAKGR